MENPEATNSEQAPASTTSPPSVAALAAENAKLRQELEARSKAFQEASTKATEYEGLYTGLRTRARRDRVVSKVAGSFRSPTAVAALADQEWKNLDAIERPDGATDEQVEELQANALYERLAAIDNGILLREQGGTVGGGTMTGPQSRPPQAPFNPYQVTPK